LRADVHLEEPGHPQEAVVRPRYGCGDVSRSAAADGKEGATDDTTQPTTHLLGRRLNAATRCLRGGNDRNDVCTSGYDSSDARNADSDDARNVDSDRGDLAGEHRRV